MKSQLLFLILAMAFLSACKDVSNKAEKKESAEIQKSSVKEENVSYNADSVALNGFVVYDTSIKTPLPVVLIVHEWWGLNDYVKSRARQLAGMGYLAMAVDMYGNNQIADNPKDASGLAGPIYDHPQGAKARFDAALKKIKSYSVADTNRMVAIGYCFGGSMVLNFARLGEKDLKAVVSFHGNLEGVPTTQTVRSIPLLVCHGEADKFVNASEVKTFKRQMDSVKAHYTFKSYPNATHAFTNPTSTETGKKFNIPIEYNQAADTNSWNDMKAFFSEVLK